MLRSSEGRSPWVFIPTLYFQQGLPVIVIQQFSLLMYKKLGVPNEQITLLTSLIAWPWTLKMLWGPWIERIGTKRRWIHAMQALVTLFMALAAVSLASTHFLALSLTIFFVAAFFSATHDIALDGLYLLALRKDQQAFFTGIRTTCFRLGWIFATGPLVIFAGLWERSRTSVTRSWQNALFVGAGVYGLLMLYGFWATPRLKTDGPLGSGSASGWRSFVDAFRSFFARPDAGIIVAFIVFYRFGEAMLTKLSGPFLIDARSAGGLGLETVQVGSIGIAGTVSLLAGGVVGGLLISRYGLRRLLWLMAIVMNLPNLPYVWAAHAQPGVASAYVLTSVEQFGYGFGMTSLMVFMLYVCRDPRYATSHYAIVSAILYFGGMLAGITSGLVQRAIGYPGFFVAVCVSTIPGMLLLRRIPLEDDDSASVPEMAPAH